MSRRRTRRFLGALAVVPWLIGGVSPVPDATPPTVSDVPTTIDATGERDVTAELQAFIDGVPDGGVARLAKTGAYRVEGTLLLTERNGLRIDGNGSRLFATTTGERSRSHLRIVGGSGLVIYDLEIAGANPYAGVEERAYQPDLAFQHGIRLEGVTDVELARVTITDTYGDFVYVGRTSDGRWTERVWIHDSVFARSGRQGIAVTAGRDVVIERNTITDTRRATVDLEPNGPTWGAQNIHILDNEIGPGRLLFLAAAGNGPVDRVVVVGNQLRGRVLTTIVRPPDGTRRAGFYFVDNTSDTPAKGVPLHLTRVDGVVVTGNTQLVATPGEPFVDATDVCGLVVANNTTGPGTPPFADVQPACGTPPPLEPPAPPPVAGRPVSGAVVPTSSTTTSTTTPPATSARPTDSADAGDGDDNTIVAVIAFSAVAAVAAAGLIAWAVIRARRAEPRDARRRSPPSPTR